MMSTVTKRVSPIDLIKKRLYPRRYPDGKFVDETCWRVIKQAIGDLYNDHCTSLSFEEIHRNCYQMVLFEFGDRLYTGLVNTIAYHLRKFSQSINSAQGEVFLEELNKKWAHHNWALQRIADNLIHLGRAFIPSNHKTPVHELGLNLWRQHVIFSDRNPFWPKLQNTLLGLVLRERNGELIHRGLIRNVKNMLMDLNLYVDQKHYERQFLDATLDFYQLESQKFIKSCDCGDYLKHAEKRLNEEIERASLYLDARSESKIAEVVEKEMIQSRIHTLVHMENSGLLYMLMGNRYEDLAKMYNLLRRVPGRLTIVKDEMASFIRNTGEQLVNYSENPVAFVQHLLDLKDKYHKAITLAFNNDMTFHTAVNSAFEDLIKNFDAQFPEYILLFVVDKLCRGLDGEEVVEFVLDKAMMLFLYPQKRYMFENSGRTYDLFCRIENHMQPHMENFGYMLTGGNYEDLSRMYNLFRRVPGGLTIVGNYMTSFIRYTGEQLINGPERLTDPVALVQRLLDLMDHYDKVIKEALDYDITFFESLNSAFEYFINLNARIPEFISLFVDDKLRRGFIGVGEEDVEIILDKVMTLLRYLQEKDVFEKYYKQHLAKRLLSGKTISDDAERSLIVKLKTECGYEFTCKLEGMFTDMKTSQDTMQGFYASHGDALGDSPTLSVQVLTTDSWPTQSSAQCNLPSEVLGVCDKFQSYYLGTHNGRRLSWQTNMGGACLKATFGNGQEHELIVSTYQMCVLMLFNNADRLTCKEIEKDTAIPVSDLRRCLHSLAYVEGKNVLRKEPVSQDVTEDDVFFFNYNFTSELFKLEIGTVVTQMESELENQETRQRVEEDRKPQIESAIMWIMKFKRVLDHNDIVTEVTNQLQARFLPDPVLIKERIESLIERGFLERDKVDRKLYRYLP